MVLITIIKVAIVGGTIYATKELGVWDSSDVTSGIYEDAKSQIKPYGTQLMDKHCCKVCEICQGPSPKPWRESMVDAWNDTVKKTFDTFLQLPTYCRRFSEDVQETIQTLFQK
ncbi:MICOS complex subunit MIC13 homolog QIL1 [Drosophila tropicalis]|uniref:MICOS complex subunit MIC13 homolog QIL1 n=1 Tax=Drosophila tropicalis TaxID=46794 RepID=UPI0035ABE71C